MRINSLKYKDKIQKWEISKIDFFNLTLLVGISGVGKTQILNSILRIKEIADGASLNGVEWEIAFSNEDNDYYWTGEFESLDEVGNPFSKFFPHNDNDTTKPKILQEQIFINGDLILNRDNTKIEFKGVKMPKLSTEESLLNIFKEEDEIETAYNGFQKIKFRDHTNKAGIRLNFLDYEVENSKYKTLDEIKDSNLDTTSKLRLLYQNEKEAFKEIVESYKDIFPQVEDVKIEPVKNERLPRFLANVPVIQFREEGVNKWISQDNMSSGMFRTFLHVSDMYLLSKGTVVLIDEFENSLGVNCINVLTEDLIFENSNLQFIATSHHPYIINKIPYDYWKIVTRKGGDIKTFDAKDFHLGNSNHERFINLINLPQYKRGILSLS